jgi:uncharacterized protein YecE (DUF72 family)
MAEAKVVRCGVAGWSFPGWDAAVYPRPKPRGFQPLAYLSRFFDVIEINTSFYQPIRPEVARLWLRHVAENHRFRFTAKLGRTFTHERCLDPEEVERFARGLRPLRDEGKLGCLLMQFPWSFRFTEENRDFLIRLRRQFAEFPLVAEMRHSSWLREEALGLLIDYHVGFCNLDQPQRQSCLPVTACLTSPVGYVRLHGRGNGGWLQEFDEPPRDSGAARYLYTPEELAGWADRIGRIQRFADAVYVVATNNERGRSVVNALQLQSLLGLAKECVPQTLAAVWRNELGGLPPDRPVQSCLFEAARAVA